MNKLTIALILLIILFGAGCVTDGQTSTSREFNYKMDRCQDTYSGSRESNCYQRVRERYPMENRREIEREKGIRR